jgi:hypothetical protein
LADVCGRRGPYPVNPGKRCGLTRARPRLVLRDGGWLQTRAPARRRKARLGSRGVDAPGATLGQTRTVRAGRWQRCGRRWRSCGGTTSSSSGGVAARPAASLRGGEAAFWRRPESVMVTFTKTTSPSTCTASPQVIPLAQTSPGTTRVLCARLNASSPVSACFRHQSHPTLVTRPRGARASCADVRVSRGLVERCQQQF